MPRTVASFTLSGFHLTADVTGNPGTGERRGGRSAGGLEEEKGGGEERRRGGGDDAMTIRLEADVIIVTNCSPRCLAPLPSSWCPAERGGGRGEEREKHAVWVL